MKVTIRAASVAVAMLAVLLVSGCARTSGPQRATVATCTAYGVKAIQHHITVRWRPAACQGLTKAQINFAVGRAIYEVAGSGQRKAAWRARARADGAFLSHMVTAVPRPESTVRPSLGARTRPAAPARHGGATGIAALIAWLITVTTGAYMLARWISHGGLRRRRSGGGGLPPAVIFSHFGLATAGLLAWITYLVTDWTASAWTAAGLLMPVTGLGISLVTLSAPARFLPAAGATARVAVGAGAPAPPGPAAPSRPVGSRLSVWVIAGHGVAATITILLVLLAALSSR